MTRSESSLAAKDRERPQSGGKALPPMACEEEINRVFHLRHESAAVAVPPDLLHARQAVRIYVLGPDHLFKTKAAMAAPDAARLHPAVRGLADAKAGDNVVHHDCPRLDLRGHGLAAFAIACPDAGGQSKLGVVGQSNGLGVGVERH